MKPVYLMLVGLPASGKTTLARQIVAAFPTRSWHIVSTDDYIEDQATRAGSTYDAVFKDAIDAATKEMNASRTVALSQGRSIIHDQTNLTVKSRARKFASVPDAYLRIGILCDSPHRASRLAARSGKTIPSEIDAKMVADFQPISADEFSVIATGEFWREALEPHI